MNTAIPENTFFYLLENSGENTVENDLLKLASLNIYSEIQLLNYYKEVPVSATAKIMNVFENSLICRTNEVQTRVIEFSEYTIIKGDPFQYHVYANALHNKSSEDITLSCLQYVDVHSNNRRSVRVRMQVPPVIGLEAGTTKFNGRMLDLSLDGCAVNIPDKSCLGNFSFFYLTIDMPAKLSQTKSRTTRVLAKLTKIDQCNKLFRCIFLFEHDKSSEDHIGTIIARRQTEIIRELSP